MINLKKQFLIIFGLILLVGTVYSVDTTYCSANHEFMNTKLFTSVGEK